MSRITKRRGITFRNDGATVTRHGSALTAFRYVALVVTLFSFMSQGGYGQDAPGATCSLNGIVFVGDPGSELYVPKAEVLVSGPVMAITGTDEEGKYAFDNLPPGTYAVEVSFKTLKAELSIRLDPSQVI